MAKLSISRAWDETRDIFRRDGKLITAVALALVVLPQVVAGLVAPPETSAAADPSAGVQLMRIAVALIALVGQLAIIRLALGPSTTVSDAIQHGARRFPAAFGALLLMILALAVVAVPVFAVLAIGLGVSVESLQGQPSGPAALLILLLVLAVIAISIRFALVSPVASAERVGPLTILKRSWHLTAGNYWRLLGFVVLLLIAALAILLTAAVVGGLLARLVSSTVDPLSLSALLLALVTAAAQGAFAVLTAVMMARIYAQSVRSDSDASVPRSGT